MSMHSADRNFQERVARINSGKQYEAENVIGMRTMAAYEKGKKRGKYGQKKAKSKFRLTELLLAPFALACGAAAVVAAQALQFHYASTEFQTATIGVPGYLLLAILFAIILKTMFSLYGGLRGPTEFVGFMGMLFFSEHVVARYPDLFVPLFSPAYVAEAIRLAGPLT